MGLADRLWGKNSKIQCISDIQDVLEIIINDLCSVHPSIEIYLFGSYAKETATVSSDLDIAVILPDDMSKKKFRKEFYVKRSPINIPVDFIFKHKSELEHPSEEDHVADEVRITGKKIYPRGEKW